MNNTADQFKPDAVEQDGGSVLVLGDDSRMRQLVGPSLAGCDVDYQEDFFAALAALGRGDYQLILINAERSARKSVDLARAIRETGTQARTFFYGDAFSEIYTHRALRRDAEDFLVWPMRIDEIKKLFGNRFAADSAQADRQSHTPPAICHELLAGYHQLSLLIPQGVMMLIEEAERLLKNVLRVAWVRIRTVSTQPSEQHDAPGAAESLELRGPNGAAGQMTLGPACGMLSHRPELAAQAAELIGTLIQLAQREASLRHLATTDELTGAYNRRYLKHFVKQMIAQSASHPTRMTLLLFDIDEFKHYNDSYGHAAGDQILKETFELMKRCCRAHDIVARLGGDEFVVLFWDSGQRREKYKLFDDLEDTQTPDSDGNRDPMGPTGWDHDAMVEFMSNRFRRVVRTFEFKTLGTESRGVLTISGGLARYPDDGQTLDALMCKADRALLDAKRLGKNRIVLAQTQDV